MRGEKVAAAQEGISCSALCSYVPLVRHLPQQVGYEGPWIGWRRGIASMKPPKDFNHRKTGCQLSPVSYRRAFRGPSFLTGIRGSKEE